MARALTLARIVLLVVVACAVLAGCRKSDSSKETQPTDSQSKPSSDANGVSDKAPLFSDITKATGIDFVHAAASTVRDHPTKHYYPDIMAGGVCAFDADNDGWIDLYFTNGSHPDLCATSQYDCRDRFYRRNAAGSFVDETDASGLGHTGYSMGCAVADIDNDGDLDLYVTAYGQDVLYRNDGDGTFTDITKSSGVDNAEWSASVSFLDYDVDGWLDVYVTNYVDYTEAVTCRDAAGRFDFCGPKSSPGVADVLYRNKGDGTFEDKSIAARIAAVSYAGLGVVSGDLDGDGWPDIYVANDADPNLLWINQKDGTFVEEALMRGAAYNAGGEAEAGMGIAHGDPDNDTRIDLFVTHLIGETNTFYRNIGNGDFDDETAITRLGVASLDLTGFGTAMFDADLDGHADLAVANGAVKRRATPLDNRTDFWSDYAEPNLFFHNLGDARFAQPTPPTSLSQSLGTSRSLLPVDIDRDGDLDVIITNIDHPPHVYQTNAPNGNHWLAVRAVTADGMRDAIGATVEVVFNQSERRTSWVAPPGGYQSGGESVVHFGLGSAADFQSLEVIWPGGQRERFGGGKANRTINVQQGTGTIVVPAGSPG